MSFLIPKRTMEAPNVGFGVCLWKLSDGSYIVNEKQEYLVSQGRIYDSVIERKMASAAKELGFEDGKPFWLPGFRKVSLNEWEDHMERLIDGKIPDPVDAYIQNKGKND